MGTKSGYQYYALPKNNLDFIGQVLREHNLFSELTYRWPSQKKAMHIDAGAPWLSDPSELADVDCVTLYVSNPLHDPFPLLGHRYDESTIEKLTFRIGEIKNGELLESQMGSWGVTDAGIRLWRSVLRKFKKVTLEGTWYLDRQSKLYEFYRGTRYFSDVASWEKEGHSLKQFDESLTACFIEEPKAFGQLFQRTKR